MLQAATAYEYSEEDSDLEDEEEEPRLTGTVSEATFEEDKQKIADIDAEQVLVISNEVCDI